MKKTLSAIDQAVLIRAIEQSPASIVITDTDGIIQYVNPKFESITGYSFTEAIGQNPRILKSGHQPEEFYQNMWGTILRGEVWDGIFHNKQKNGSYFWEHCIIAPVTDEHGNVTHFVAIKEDITEKKEQEEALRKSEEELRKRNDIISKDLEYAKRVQQSIINTPIPEYPGIKIVTYYSPYDFVGGDFYTIKKINHDLAVFMADITGHGVPAALFSSVLKYATENLWNNEIIQPDEFIHQLNEKLFPILGGYYFTALYGLITPLLDGGFQLTYTRSGHPYPIVLSGDAIAMLDSSGIPLGIEKNLKLLVKNIELKKGDRLFLYTDGLIEIDVNNQKDLRFDILTKEIIATKQIALDDAVQKIIEVVTSQNKTLDDDIAVIALEIC